MGAVIRVEGLVKRFGDLTVLQGIDAEVHNAEVVCVIGPSGSGKSTFLRCLNGLEEASAGQVWVHDTPVHDAHTDLNALRADIGMVFQRFNLFPHRSVLDNLTLAPTKVRGLTPAQARERALGLLAKVGLSDKAAAYPNQLSGGQQQRVAIARALAMQPQVMLFDEPTSALDPELVGEVLKVVETLAEEGMTLLMVTHEMNFARKVADRVVFMHAGRIHEMGPPAELFSAPRTPELQQFLSALH